MDPERARPDTGEALLDAELRGLVARLRLAARRVRAGGGGAQRGAAGGARLELADFRDYEPGDDLRDLDWAAYARREALVIKRYEPTSRQPLCVVLDDSASMAAGEPDKWRCARRIALALGALAMARRDPARVLLPSAGEVWGPYDRAPQATALADALGRARAIGTDDLARALARHAARLKSPGRYVLVSDLWSTEDLEGALAKLAGPHLRWAAVHVLAADELAPPLDGTFALEDAESGVRLAASIDDTVRAAYRAEIGKVVDHWTAACARARVAYALADTGRPLADLLLGPLRACGLVA